MRIAWKVISKIIILLAFFIEMFNELESRHYAVAKAPNDLWSVLSFLLVFLFSSSFLSRSSGCVFSILWIWRIQIATWRSARATFNFIAILLGLFKENSLQWTKTAKRELFFPVTQCTGWVYIIGGFRYAITWVRSAARSWNSCRLHTVNVNIWNGIRRSGNT